MHGCLIPGNHRWFRVGRRNLFARKDEVFSTKRRARVYAGTRLSQTQPTPRPAIEPRPHPNRSMVPRIDSCGNFSLGRAMMSLVRRGPRLRQPFPRWREATSQDRGKAPRRNWIHDGAGVTRYFQISSETTTGGRRASSLPTAPGRSRISGFTARVRVKFPRAWRIQGAFPATFRGRRRVGAGNGRAGRRTWQNPYFLLGITTMMNISSHNRCHHRANRPRACAGACLLGLQGLRATWVGHQEPGKFSSKFHKDFLISSTKSISLTFSG
jgi:hypothetical protein